MDVKIKLLTDTARVPTYATDGSAAFDIYADEADLVEYGRYTKFRTGISVEVPAGHVLKVYGRSGHAFKDGVRLVNCTGIIDADYRGEVMVGLVCDQPGGCAYIKHGDRIAQGIIMPVEKTNFIVADELSETVRGTNGCGSSGA